MDSLLAVLSGKKVFYIKIFFPYRFYSKSKKNAVNKKLT
jgi:hypothetical protein